MHKISVISDTHGLLRPQVIRMLSGCDAILHSGDFDREEKSSTSALYILHKIK